MIIKSLIFLWVFILPIFSFLCELFYHKADSIPPLNKEGTKAFHKELFIFSVIIPVLLAFLFLIVFVKDNSFSELGHEISVLFENIYTLKTPLWKLCLWEILYLDFFIALMFSTKNNFTIKNFFNWQWVKKNWPIIEASLPSFRVWSYLHMFIVFLSVHHLGNAECKFVLFLYPISSYFYAKRVYTYYIFQKKGLCKLNREGD